MRNFNMNNCLEEDSLYKAYILGYFQADGNLKTFETSSDGLHHTLRFECKDRDLLERINEPLGVDIVERQRTVRTGTVCTVYMLNVTGLYAESIYNCMDGYKDFSKWFFSASDKEQDEYVKGFFDGDGTVSEYRTGRLKIGFYVVDEPTDRIIKYYLDKHDIKYVLSRDKRGKGLNHYEVCRTMDVMKLYDRWYGKVYLQRKYLKLKKQADALKVVVKATFPEGEKRYYLSRKEAVRDTGVSNSSITDSLVGRNKYPKGFLFEEVTYSEFREQGHSQCE